MGGGLFECIQRPQPRGERGEEGGAAVGEKGRALISQCVWLGVGGWMGWMDGWMGGWVVRSVMSSLPPSLTHSPRPRRRRGPGAGGVGGAAPDDEEERKKIDK